MLTLAVGIAVPVASTLVATLIAKLSTEKVDAIRRLRGRLSSTDIAWLFSVSRQTVDGIYCGARWAAC
jgi:hypothetical protein